MAVLVAPRPADLRQGSVVDAVPWGLPDPPLGVVLSNACDLEHDKASFILLGALKPAVPIIHESEDWKSLTKDLPGGPQTKRKWEKIERLCTDWIFNREIGRYFAIDSEGLLGLGTLFVDFQHLMTVPSEEAPALQVIAGLESPYREQLVMHFGAYLSRIGAERPGAAATNVMLRRMAHPFAPPKTP